MDLVKVGRVKNIVFQLFKAFILLVCQLATSLRILHLFAGFQFKSKTMCTCWRLFTLGYPVSCSGARNSFSNKLMHTFYSWLFCGPLTNRIFELKRMWCSVCNYFNGFSAQTLIVQIDLQSLDIIIVLTPWFKVWFRLCNDWSGH